MNNEEKNPLTESEAVEVNEASAESGAKKLSPGLLGAIIGGASVIVIAVILMLTLIPRGGDQNDGQQGGEPGGQTEQTKITYTVTAVDTEGNPVKGVTVTFSPQGSMEIPFDTEADGKASFKTDKPLSVSITKLPKGYEYDKLNVFQAFDESGNLTVVLVKPAPYVIKVVDQDGNVVSGVRVQMCNAAGMCYMPVTTGEDGTATYAYESGEFHAQLTTLPQGYLVENPEQYYDFIDGVATIVLTKIG